MNFFKNFVTCRVIFNFSLLFTPKTPFFKFIFKVYRAFVPAFKVNDFLKKKFLYLKLMNFRENFWRGPKKSISRKLNFGEELF